MSTDTLDEHIRRMVTQVVESSPSPPLLDRPRSSFGQHRRRRPTMIVAISLVSVLALVLGVVLLTRGDDRSQQPGGSTGSGESLAGYLDVEALATLHFDRDVYTVGAGRVRVNFTGATGHTLVIDDPRVHMLLSSDVGGRHTAVVTLRPGTYTIGDSVPGHRQAGMIATLHVLHQPARWITPSGSSTPLTPPDAATPSGTSPSRAAGRSLARLIHSRVLWADAVAEPDLIGYPVVGKVARAVVAVPEQVDVATYRLPVPVTLGALTSDPVATLATTRGGSQLVSDHSGGEVFLVRRDGTVLHLTNGGRAPTPPMLRQLALRLDDPGLSRILR
jgi:hypothetical protein